MKKLSTLLSQRPAVLRQARLANIAFAYASALEFRHRIERAGLRGRVTLKHAAPHADRYWASLTALDLNQSVIEEHFSDENLMELADVVAFVTGNDAVEMTFAFEDVTELFLTPLREELEREGVTIDQPAMPVEEQQQRE
jgi:hypothetical protein